MNQHAPSELLPSDPHEQALIDAVNVARAATIEAGQHYLGDRDMHGVHPDIMGDHNGAGPTLMSSLGKEHRRIVAHRIVEDPNGNRRDYLVRLNSAPGTPDDTVLVRRTNPDNEAMYEYTFTRPESVRKIGTVVARQVARRANNVNTDGHEAS